jgi:hypothetical protein
VGAKLARGEFTALLDSDDWWAADKIETQLAVARENTNALVSSRVIAVRNTMRKAAPWRTIAKDERVEEFLYVHKGMLQTSTILAQKDTLISLLSESAEFSVHNDTMLFLEAQKQGLDIVQMSEPLSFFDDNPRSDRISYDASRVEASIAWFKHVSLNWSIEARKGYMLTDMVTRYVNTGQRSKATEILIKAYYPGVNLKSYFKKAAYILFNGSPLRFLRK